MQSRTISTMSLSTRDANSFINLLVKNSVAGTVAGVAGCLVGHPFDTLKVRLQTQPVHQPLYNGLVDCFMKTLKWEGVGGLYKGMGSPIVGQVLFRATLFTSYYQITWMLGSRDGSPGQRLTRGQYFLAGALTGTVSALVESPIDLFKTKMQIQILRDKSGRTAEYRNVFHAGWEIAKNHGVRGVFQGLPSTLLRNVPATFWYFGTWESSREYFTPPGKSIDDVPLWALFLSGGISGFLFWFMTYPADVTKSSMQSDASLVCDRRFKSIAQCIRRLYAEGGWRRFYVGMAPCLLRAVPANAVMLFVMETCRVYLP